MTKELEPKSELKVKVIGAGTQLVQMRQTDGDSDGNLEDKATRLLRSSGLDHCSISSKLRQTELDWCSLLGAVPVVQEALHKVN